MKQVAVNESFNIKVTLRHSSNHNTIEEYAKEAVRPLVRVFPGIISCHIILDHQNNDFEKNKLAEITVNVPQHVFIAKDACATYEQGIDNCVAALHRQILKYKEKLQP